MALADIEGRPIATQARAAQPAQSSGARLAQLAERFAEHDPDGMTDVSGAFMTNPTTPPSPQQAVAEWQTPPASWRLLAKAAINLLCAIDEKHDTQSPPLKYAVPYGAVNDLRRALGAADPATPTHQAAEPPVHECENCPTPRACAYEGCHGTAGVPVHEDTVLLDWLEKESGEDIDNVEIWACWPAKYDRLRDAIRAALVSAADGAGEA